MIRNAAIPVSAGPSHDRRLPTVLLATALALCAALPAIGQQADTGKTLEESLAVLRDKTADAGARAGACRALGALGPAAASAAELLLAELKSDGDSNVYEAAVALGRIGADPATAVPAILAAFRSAARIVIAGKEEFPPPHRLLYERIGEVLLPFGETGAKGLLGFLEDAEPDLAAIARKSLPEFGSAAKAAVPTLAKGLADASPGVRTATARGLGKLGPAASEAAAALGAAAAMEDNFDARRAMLDALADIGPGAAPAVPSLLKLLEPGKLKDTILNRSLWRALGDIGPGAKEALPALARLVQAPRDAAVSDSDDATDRAVLSTAVAQIDAAHPQGVLVLIAMAREAGDRGDAALRHFSLLGRAGRAALPALLEIATAPLPDPSENDAFRASVRRHQSALAGILMIGAEGAQTAPLLEWARAHEAGAGDAAGLAKLALSAASTAGPAARDTVPLIVSMLKKTPGDEGLCFALSRIAPDVRPAAEVLRAGLASGKRWQAVYCALAILRMEPADADARALLKKELAGIVNKMRVEQKGAPAPEAALFERDFCAACAFLGAEAREQVGPLRDLAATHADPEIRRLAAEALAAVEAK